MTPLLGAARNSPMVSRKVKDVKKEPDVQTSGSFKAFKLLGMDPSESPPVGSAPSGRTSGADSSSQLTIGRKVSPRPAGGVQTVNKDFLRELQAYKQRQSQEGQGGGPVVGGSSVDLRKKGSTHELVHKASSPDLLASSQSAGSDGDFDANDTIETLREKLEQQKVRYEKWKKEHLDDTRLKLSILTEENRKLQEQVTESNQQVEAWKTSYENLKSVSMRQQQTWEEERQKLLKRYTEDQKKIEKLQKLTKKGTKPQGLPKEMKSSIFGRGKPPSEAPMVPAGVTAPASGVGDVSMSLKRTVSGSVSVGEPRLVTERDSTPLPVPAAVTGGGSSTTVAHRVRTPQDFELHAVIGQGGFGAVFLCREPATGLVCAVKRMAKAMIVAKEQVHTVNVEVNVLKEARQENNLWIVQFHYAFQDTYYIYLAMEFCSGGDLRSLIDNVELDEDGVRFFAAEMIVSVNSLHERGYVHRDLKPSNFLITHNGHLKLADFGLSKSGFSGVKKPAAADQPQAIRVFLVDDAYKTLIVNAETTVSEVIKQLKMKLRIAKNAPWLVYECNTLNGLQRERPMALDEKPIKVAETWQKGLHYKFLFKEADASRVAAMARTRVETSHRDPFFQGQQKPNRRERLYSVVGSPHYMAAEILEGSGYDAVVDWWSMGCILYEMLVGAPPFTGNSAEEVFASVLNSKESLKFPSKEERDISDDARDLIIRFLSPPKERIGYNGVGEIKQHPFFSNINWTGLHLMTPPFEPGLDDEFDCGYFDSATTEGIEDMRMDDPPKDPQPLSDDPWKDSDWDWSDVA